jgi:hypothetical protein
LKEPAGFIYLARCRWWDYRHDRASLKEFSYSHRRFILCDRAALAELMHPHPMQKSPLALPVAFT